MGCDVQLVGMQTMMGNCQGNVLGSKLYGECLDPHHVLRLSL